MNAIRLSTRTLVILAICAASALLLSACAASDNTNTTSGTANSNTTTTTTTTTTTSAPASNTPATTAATNTATTNTAATTATANNANAPAGDKVGVEECDDFLAKYETCLNSKIPEAARAQYRATLTQTRDAWRKAAATPQGKASLAQACKTMRDTTKQAMTPYGCTF